MMKIRTGAAPLLVVEKGQVTGFVSISLGPVVAEFPVEQAAELAMMILSTSVSCNCDSHTMQYYLDSGLTAEEANKRILEAHNHHPTHCRPEHRGSRVGDGSPCSMNVPPVGNFPDDP